LAFFLLPMCSVKQRNCYFFCNWWCLANVRDSLKYPFIFLRDEEKQSRGDDSESIWSY
jgi:hypothetical protein